MYDKISWMRRVARIGTLLQTFLCGKFVGADEYGNHYFESRGSRKKRWVLYPQEAEASLVPPVWFGWLHHQMNEPLPQDGKNSYPWQRAWVPNLTGSEAAYVPSGHMMSRLASGARDQETAACQSWRPSFESYRDE